MSRAENSCSTLTEKTQAGPKRKEMVVIVTGVVVVVAVVGGVVVVVMIIWIRLLVTNSNG